MSKVNLLNIAKREGLFKAFIARPGHSLVYCDFAAAEMKVMTFLSRDPTMLLLYGPDAKKPQDIYCFNGAHQSLFADRIRSHYDPYNPTPETVAAVKEACKDIRPLLKTFSLSVVYGAQPRRIKAELNLAGHDISLHDAEVMFHDYWKTYKGVKRYEYALKKQWENNNGWIYNGRGRPLPIDEFRLRDCVNSSVQSTCHDLLMRYLVYINRLRHERQVPMKPFICDLHDSTTWEVEDEYIDQAVAVYSDSLKLLNEEIGWDVEITGDIKVGKNLAEVSLD